MSWWHPREIAKQGLQGAVFSIVGGAALSLISGVLASVAPFTDGWTAVQLALFVSGTAGAAFVLGVVLVSLARQALPILRSLTDASESSLTDGVHLLANSLVQVERTRAELAEDQVKRLVADNDSLRHNFQRSEESAREHATKAHDAWLAEGKAQIELAEARSELTELSLRRAGEQPLLSWAESMMQIEVGLSDRWIRPMESTCYFGQIHQRISSRVVVVAKYLYLGVLPIEVGETSEGWVSFERERFLTPPEVSRSYVHRGQTFEVRLFQSLTKDSEVRAIQEILDGTGKATVDCGNVRVSIRATRPDGVQLEEWLRLPDSVEGAKPVPPSPSE